MKAVLCALNAKYIHTNLAVRYIKAFVDKHTKGIDTEIIEETVNTKEETILEKLLEKNPSVILFSVYIWNAQLVLRLCEKIRENAPEVFVVLGGPEVSFAAKEYLSYPFVDFVQCGEGERPTAVLLEALLKGEQAPKGYGICYKKDGEFVLEKQYSEPDLNALESPYADEYISAVSGRLAYFESSRGCPFSCAFCLSGACKGVRNFHLDYVKSALLKFLKSGVKTVKFVDRTFNADSKRADEIISFLMEHSGEKPKVCFHFEIAADILKESTLKLLQKAPKGLFQIEAGIQSFNKKTLSGVTRKNNVDKVCENVRALLKNKNVHTHVDLIAGLPYEDYESFRVSFNRAYDLKADMLQLGFLKLLHGSRLREEKEQHGFVFEEKAPYTVKATNWLTEEEMEKLYAVEDANEKIHNAGRFRESLSYVLEVSGKTPFDLFLEFGRKPSMSLDDYTEQVYIYFSNLPGVEKAVLRDLLCIDRLRTNSTGKLPEVLKIKDARKKKIANVLPKVAKNTKRAICILYSKGQAVYVDYKEKETPPYHLNFVDLEKF